MKKFYSDYNQVKVRQIQALLEDAGIPCFIKNEFIQGASGELPPHETLPEIWLVDDEWQKKAQHIVDQLEQDLCENTEQSWLCGSCKQLNEGQFMICWQCQQQKPQS